MDYENKTPYTHFSDVGGNEKIIQDILDFKNSEKTATSSNSVIDLTNVYVYEPKAFEEVSVLIEYIKTRQAAIINLDKTDEAVAQRILDFMTGAVCGLEGKVARISGNIFLLSPKGVEVNLPQGLN